MTLPKLSVVVPNYNHARYLPACLRAVLEQSAPPAEIIVIDDASTDNSLEVLNQLTQQHPTIRLYSNERNQGVLHNLNRGIELAREDYLLFAAADDEVMPGLFEKSLRLLAEHPQAGLSCTVSEWRYTDSDLRFHVSVGMADRPAFLSPDDLVRISRKGKLLISSSSVVFRRQALRDVGQFIPELRWHTDWFAENVAAFRFGLCFVPEPLSLVNILPKSYYTGGRGRPEHRQVLTRILELLNTPAYADVRPLIRSSGILSVFATPMLRVMLGRKEFKPFINFAFLRRTLWRAAELTGKKVLPVWLSRWVLNRLYRHQTSEGTLDHKQRETAHARTGTNDPNNVKPR